MQRILIIIPTYNEGSNIANLTTTILGQDPQYEICVVDDNSPDGTAAIVRDLQATYPDRLFLQVREGKDGRGGAVRAGLEWGLASSKNYAAFVEMDSDFSHPPAALATGLRLLAAGNDVALGSRYPDGTIIGWPLGRRLFSRLANLLVRILISTKIHDYTNGFRFYTRDCTRFLIDQKQNHKGYIYLSEMLAALLANHYKIASFPITFRNRERGVSNTNLSEIKQALKGIFMVAWSYRRQVKAANQSSSAHRAAAPH